MKNIFINNYRKKQLQPPQSDFAEIEDAFESRVSEEAGRQIKSPEEVLLEDVLDEDVQRALDDLAPDYRMAVILAAAAMLMISLPQRMEMINRRGWSSSACR